MQTNFTPKQLEDSRIAEADRILRRCVHCGLCTATCSTYVLLGDERDSPRGRIYMMKDMFERGRKASAEVQFHVDRCLSCLSCMSTCPSGVDYMHLVDMARGHIEATGNRRLKDRLVRRLLARVVPDPRRFRRALKAAPIGVPFVGLMRRLGLKELAAMVELAPKGVRPLPKSTGQKTVAAEGGRRGRVILLAGCVQQVLRPEINNSTIQLLARRGFDVEVAADAGCCGALVHHLGRETEAIAFVKRNVDAWSKLLSAGPVDAIVINASGCGTTVKDYGHMMQHVAGYSEPAQKISEMTKDVSEFLYEANLGAPKRWSSLRVAYHSACSLQHGQRIHDEPKALLQSAGFTVVDIPDGHICCGSAGTYNILQPEIATELRDRKVLNIRSVKPDVVAAGNIGCIMQLAPATDMPIVHTVELLDWAYGGPVPRGLERFEDRHSEVPDPQSERTAQDYIGA
jgi:glycolate oxidase iron-sulfur subunit